MALKGVDFSAGWREVPSVGKWPFLEFSQMTRCPENMVDSIARTASGNIRVAKAPMPEPVLD